MLRRHASTALALFGVLGFFLGPVVVFLGDAAVPHSFELPFGDPDDIAVSPAGIIYVHLAFYGRIQAYDPSGHFLRGWSSRSAGGGIRLHWLGTRRLRATAERTGKTVSFDSTGTVLAVSSDLPYEERIPPILEVEPSGDTLQLEDSIWWPTVDRLSSHGRHTVIHSSAAKWLFAGPLPVFLFGVAGMGLRWWYRVMR